MTLLSTPIYPKCEFALSNQVLLKIFKILKDIGCHTVWLNVKNDYIDIIEMDPSHVSLVHVKLGKESFENLSVYQNGKIVLDIDYMITVLKMFNPRETITIQCDAEILVQVIGDNLRMDILQTDWFDNQFNLPKVDLDFEFVIKDLNHFVSTLEKISKVHYYIIIDAKYYHSKKEGQLVFYSKSLDDHKIRTMEFAENIEIIKTTKAFKVSYSLEYMLGFLKNIKTTKHRIYFSCRNQFPIRIITNIDDFSFIEFYSAPRIPQSESEFYI